MDFVFGSKRTAPNARHSAGAVAAAAPPPPIQRIPATCNRQPFSLRLKNHPAPTQLHLSKYSREQIYGFFDLRPHHITVGDLKDAKRRVLMTHPDKSGLSPEYFQFYTKALQVLVDEFAEHNRESHYAQRMHSLQQSECQYDAGETAEDLELKRHYQEQASGKEFMTQFNRVFDAEMKRPVVDRNAWFRDESAHDYGDGRFQANSQKDMERALAAIKQHQQAMVVHRGIQELPTSYGGSSFYEDEEEDHGDANGSSAANHPYITTDPFAKLKFDDLRRVHKDETVLSVSERDVSGRTQFRNLEEFNRARQQVSLEPVLSEQEQQAMLQQRERQRVERIRQLQRQDELRGAEFARKQEEAKRMILQLK
jgi:hypothetical protein